MSDKIDSNDAASKLGPQAHSEYIDRQTRAAVSQRGDPLFLFGAELCRSYSEMRPCIIDGLLREGEVMNIIAPPKKRKSWLVLSMALSVANGLKWLDLFDSVKSSVLIVDNELHRETLASRYKTVAEALKVERNSNVCFMPLRGALKDLRAVAEEFERWIKDPNLLPGKEPIRLIIFDAFYRMLPEGVREEDNGQISGLYNLIDSYAKKYSCAIVVIHHTSKGAQASKSVTDIGSGAGAISRAADTHLVLRDHVEPECAVLSAATRSFGQPGDRVIRFKDHLWTYAPELDPTQISDGKKKKENSTIDQLDLAGFIASCLTDEAENVEEISARAQRKGYKANPVTKLLKRIREGPLGTDGGYCMRMGGRGGPIFFSRNWQKLNELRNKV